MSRDQFIFDSLTACPPAYASYLDYILPFAGIPENGREIYGLDDKSELAHGMMLVNLLRIFEAVKNRKASRHFVTRPTQVILPLSPNHGLFRKDGLYSESKISLERKLRHSSNDGLLKVGANISVWLVQSLGKSSTWFATLC